MGYLSSKYSNMDSKNGVFSGGLVDNMEGEKLDGKNAQVLYNARVSGKGTRRRSGYKSLVTTTQSELIPGMFGFAYQGYNYLYFGVKESGTDGQIRYQRYRIEDGLLENITHTGGSWSWNDGMVLNGAIQNLEVALHCSSGNGQYQTASTKVIGTATSGATSSVNSSNQQLFDGLFWGQYGYNLAYGTTPFVVSATIGMGELGTGVACNSQQLFAFTKRTIFAVGKAGELTSYLANTLQALEGSVSRYGVVTAGDRIFYWTPSNKVNEIGRDSIAGFQTRDLTHRKYIGVDTFMDSLDPDQSGVFGWYIPTLNLVKWACKSKGKAFNDLILCYDLETDSFMIDTNRYVTSALHYNGRTFCTDYFGGLTVFEDEVDDDDNGFAIPFTRRSKIFAFGDLSLRKHLWETRTTATITGPATIPQAIYLDGLLVRTDTMINDITINSTVGGMATSPFGAEPVGGGGYPVGDTKTQNFVVSKSKLQKKIYKMEVEWTCNTLGGNFLLQDFKAKVEGLDEATSDNSF